MPKPMHVTPLNSQRFQNQSQNCHIDKFMIIASWRTTFPRECADFDAYFFKAHGCLYNFRTIFQAQGRISCLHACWRTCAMMPVLLVILLARQLLSDRCWPKCTRRHCIHCIHKRWTDTSGKNYRCVHFTLQLSKVAERSIDTLLFFGLIFRRIRTQPIRIHKATRLHGCSNSKRMFMTLVFWNWVW